MENLSNEGFKKFCDIHEKLGAIIDEKKKKLLSESTPPTQGSTSDECLNNLLDAFSKAINSGNEVSEKEIREELDRLSKG